MSTDTSKMALQLRNTALLLLALMPVSALGTRFELWPFTLGLLLLTVSVLGSLLIQIINAIWLVRKPSAGTKNALRWASLFALPPLFIIAMLLRSNGGSANIHNISTDFDNPPDFIAAIVERGADSNPLEYSDEIASIQRQFFPNVKPIITQQSPEQAFAQAISTAESMGWTIYAQNAEQGHIEAMDQTFWFGFKDDIVIRIQETENGSRIDLRSVSRVGKSDIGANAARIIKFNDLFNQQ